MMTCGVSFPASWAERVLKRINHPGYAAFIAASSSTPFCHSSFAAGEDILDVWTCPLLAPLFLLMMIMMRLLLRLIPFLAFIAALLLLLLIHQIPPTYGIIVASCIGIGSTAAISRMIATNESEGSQRVKALTKFAAIAIWLAITVSVIRRLKRGEDFGSDHDAYVEATIVTIEAYVFTTIILFQLMGLFRWSRKRQ
jgi:hypothetical protein